MSGGTEIMENPSNKKNLLDGMSTKSDLLNVVSSSENQGDTMEYESYRARRAREQAEIQKDIEENRKYLKEKAERQKKYAEKIEESREGQEVKITKENVVAGLKHIAEHPYEKQSDIIDNLIALGCNFTFDEIRKETPEGLENNSLQEFPKMTNEMNILMGATIIANYIRYEDCVGATWRQYLITDDDKSIYSLIRTLTGDDSYTKVFVDKLINSRKAEFRE